MNSSPVSKHHRFLYCFTKPRGSTDTTIKELGPKYHTVEGIMGPNSLMVVYVDPLGQVGAFGGSLGQAT